MRVGARAGIPIHPTASHQTICGLGDDFLLFGVARAREGQAESNAKTYHHQPCLEVGIGDKDQAVWFMIEKELLKKLSKKS